MPIYEFACKSCNSEFEARVARIGERPAACPSCGGDHLEKRLSSFAAHTNGGSSASASSDVGACSMGDACCNVGGGGCGGGGMA